MSRNWFIAWPVENAAEWLNEIEASAPPGLDFLHPSDLHVSLVFLGAHDQKNESKISKLMRGLPIPGAEIVPGALVALPQPRRFSAIATSIGTGRVNLEKLIARWSPRFAREAGCALDPRLPLPHITIARPSRRISTEDRDNVLAWAESLAVPAGPLLLAPPAIYRWAAGDSPSRYEFTR